MATILEDKITPALLFTGDPNVRKIITNSIINDGKSMKQEAVEPVLPSMDLTPIPAFRSDVNDSIYPCLSLLKPSVCFIEEELHQVLLLNKGKHTLGRSSKNDFCIDSSLYPKMVSSQV